MKSEMLGHFTAISNLLKKIPNGFNLPMPLEHLSHHPELIDEKLRREIDFVHLESSICVDKLSQGLSALGELMQMADPKNEDEVHFFEDMVGRTQRIGILIDWIAGVIHQSYVNYNNADYALDNYHRLRKGEFKQIQCLICKEEKESSSQEST